MLAAVILLLASLFVWSSVTALESYATGRSEVRGGVLTLKHIRLHDMRHTAATLMLQNGVDIKTVSGMLGHYDAGFTLRIYTHSTDRQQAEAANMMGSLVAQSL